MNTSGCDMEILGGVRELVNSVRGKKTGVWVRETKGSAGRKPLPT